MGVENMGLKPIVKWAGGKRQVIDKLLENMPLIYNNYYEPFIGGGAFLFELLPNKATINDVNHELIAIYKCLTYEDFFRLMIQELDEHEKNHSEEYYYQIREVDRQQDYVNYPVWKRASRAIYLNKSCFNGLYRVNAKGYFNVPSGKKEKVQIYDRENMKLVHDYFMNNNIEVLQGDFIKAVEKANSGDFIYFDPPYDSFEDKESFTAYTKNDFSKEDQKRLADLFKELSSKGVKVMVSNHNTNYINNLYKGFNIKVIKAKRMINSDSNGRGNVEEVIITNY